MSTGTTHRKEGRVGGPVLHVALELDEKGSPQRLSNA